jgi:hypothetical protein
MNRFATAYRLELVGGSYTECTVVDSYISDTGHPIVVDGGEIGKLPDLSQLQPSRYRLRLIVLGWDANYLQPPSEVDFAVGTNRVSDLASIQLSEPCVSNGRITIREGTPLRGTVVVPEGAQFYKVEIKDDIRAGQAQATRFTDWTTLIEVHPQSVVDGQNRISSRPFRTACRKLPSAGGCHWGERRFRHRTVRSRLDRPSAARLIRYVSLRTNNENQTFAICSFNYRSRPAVRSLMPVALLAQDATEEPVSDTLPDRKLLGQRLPSDEILAQLA